MNGTPDGGNVSRPDEGEISVGQSVRAILCPGNGRIELTTKMVGRPGPGEVLLDMRASGICGSDLHFMNLSPEDRRSEILGKGLDGDPSITPGHEMAGVVEAVGEGVTALWIGQRVAVQHYSGCGNCSECRSGWDCMCSKAVIYTLKRDGGHQDKVLAVARDCIPIPDGLSFTSAAFVACGAGTSFQAIRRGGLQAGQSLASVGLGPVGLSALLWGRVFGSTTIGIDPSSERRNFALSKGVDQVFDPSDPGMLETLLRETSGGADVVIETAGNASGRSLSLDVARPRGTVVFVSFGGECFLDAPRQIVQKQLDIRGSWMFDVAAMMGAMEAAVALNVDLDGLITTTCEIDGGPEAIRAFAAGSNGKTMIVWD
ncbi:MAG: L-threonine 3-dehydrogenase [Nitrospira sp.]|nr:L-threonine 3-dehydrogenase [Nitrospira sp.]